LDADGQNIELVNEHTEHMGLCVSRKQTWANSYSTQLLVAARKTFFGTTNRSRENQVSLPKLLCRSCDTVATLKIGPYINLTELSAITKILGHINNSALIGGNV